MIRSGEIAALIEMRDKILVQAQRQLDEPRRPLLRALSDYKVDGTAVVGPPDGFNLDITGWKPGNTLTLDYRQGAATGTHHLPRHQRRRTRDHRRRPGRPDRDRRAGQHRRRVRGGRGVHPGGAHRSRHRRHASEPRGSTLQIVDDGAPNRRTHRPSRRSPTPRSPADGSNCRSSSTTRRQPALTGSFDRRLAFDRPRPAPRREPGARRRSPAPVVYAAEFPRATPRGRNTCSTA